MQHTAQVVLLIVAVCLFVLSAFGLQAKLNLASAGLACFAGAALVGLL